MSTLLVNTLVIYRLKCMTDCDVSQLSRTVLSRLTGVTEDSSPLKNRLQAIAERARAGLKNSQRGAAGFGAEPQYYSGITSSRSR